MNLTTQTLRTIDGLTLARFTLAGDELVDLFPGSGAVSAAWRAVSSGAALGDGGGRG